MTRSRGDILQELEAAGSSPAGVERTCGELKAKIASLQVELAALSPMANSGPALPPDIWAPQTPSDEVKLLRSLFHGRTDVFPVRFVSKKTGRAGYAPACSNKWLPELCLLKSGGKCSDCTNRSFIPVVEQPIVEHLQGRQVMGVYPLLEDETCWFLAVEISNGEDIVRVSRLMGHANASFTLNVYSHMIPRKHDASGDRLASLVFGNKMETVANPPMQLERPT
ncbi:MAG: TOTE conflict system archaeo-eukaryotic primase domain-containing protein [Candidatus Dormibacteraceae bacterium]